METSTLLVPASANESHDSDVKEAPMCEQLSTKFFIYKTGGSGSEADEGASSPLQIVGEQHVLISSELQTVAEDENDKAGNKASNRSQSLQHLNYFADTWSILRFIKGIKSQGVQISPDGT